MAQVCLRCNAAVSDEIVRCPECGADLDPCRTIPPPGPRPRVSSKTPSQSRRPDLAEPPSTGEHLDAPAKPKARPSSRRRPKPDAPSESRTPARDRLRLPRRFHRLPCRPPVSCLLLPGCHLRRPRSLQTCQAQRNSPRRTPSPAVPGSVRAWMIRLLGGTPGGPAVSGLPPGASSPAPSHPSTLSPDGAPYSANDPPTPPLSGQWPEMSPAVAYPPTPRFYRPLRPCDRRNRPVAR